MELQNLGRSFSATKFTTENGEPNGVAQSLEYEVEPGFGSKAYFTKRAASCCTEKTIRRKFPVLGWLKKYSKGDLLGDVIAGLTVGLTLVPQVIAFSELANLPPEYGLYAAYMGGFVYILFGTTREITIVPAAVICILIGNATYKKSTAFAVALSSILCLLSGIFALFMGFLKLGVVVEFVSAPVSAGFISAAAIIIVMSQLKSILGLTGMHGEDAIELIRGLARRINNTNLEDLALGLVCIVFLIVLREIRRIQWSCCFPPETAKKFSKIIHVVSAARNVVLIILCSIAAYVWDAKSGKWGITLTDEIRVSGIPSPALPKFTLPAGNVTVDGEIVYLPERDFADIVEAAGSAMFVIPLICIVEHIAVCKSFANRKAVDVNQELIALGMSQLVSSFFLSMPITGSISTSCVNAVSGVRTPLGGLWAGSVVMLALAFFTPYMGYIPSPALGAVVICAVLHFIEYEEAIHIWKTKRSDVIPLAITFLSCLVIGLEWGFLVGVLSNLLMLLIVTSNPSVPVLKFRISDEMRVVIFRPDRFLFYPGIQKVRNLINKGALRNKDAVIVVDCINLVDIDFTGSKGLGSIAAALQKRDQSLIFVNITSTVSKALRGFTFGDVVTYETAQDWIRTISAAANNTDDLGALKRSLSHADLRCPALAEIVVDSDEAQAVDDDEDSGEEIPETPKHPEFYTRM